jgi:hypothetical protein
MDEIVRKVKFGLRDIVVDEDGYWKKEYPKSNDILLKDWGW